MKLYVGGPMRGYDNYNFPAFWSAATELRDAGHEVTSPAELDMVKGWTEITCTCNRPVHLNQFNQPSAPMLRDDRSEGPCSLVVTWLIEDDPAAVIEMFRTDFDAVAAADGIVLLPGWENSTGARSELAVALALGKATFRYEEFAATEMLVPFTPYLKAGIGPEPGELDEARVVDPTTGVIADVVGGEVRIVDPTTGGAKGQKLARFDLLPWDVLWDVAEHFGRGAAKYEERNWQQGYAWSLSFAALQRHLAAWWEGEDVDPETGSSHLAAVSFHAMALLWFVKHNAGTDDRYRQSMDDAA